MMRHRKGKPMLQHQHSSSSTTTQNGYHRSSSLVVANPISQAAFWSQEAFFLSDLVREFPLPQVVRCANKLIPGEAQNMSVNIHVPMLLCNGRSARKLLAKHVCNEMHSKKLMETNDRIVIPNDYDGNFLRLQARTTKDMSALRSLDDVARSNCPAFITLSPLTSFAEEVNASANGDPRSRGQGANEVEDTGSSLASTKLSRGSAQSGKPSRKQSGVVHSPGSVFIVTGTSKGIVKKKKSKQVVLLRCTDLNGHHVLIPADQPAEIFEVAEPTTNRQKLSMRADELMATNRYPSLVRFVYGDHAPRLTPCSNLFTLIDTFEEDTLIGSLLYPNHALLFEIPMTSSLTFQVAMNRDDMMAMDLPRHALDMMRDRKDSFLRDLKLKCKFMHRVTQGSGHDSQKHEDDMPSATVRIRQYADEACLYL